MKLSFRYFFYFTAVLASAPGFARATSEAVPTVPVIHAQLANGKVATFKLLPASVDYSRVSEVEHRLELDELQAASVGVPSSYQIPSSYIPTVKNQGNRNTCSYFATLEILENYYQLHKQNVTLSQECLVDLRNWMSSTSSYTGTDKPAHRPEDYGDFPISVGHTILSYGVPIDTNYSAVNVDCRYRDWSFGKNLPLSNYQSVFTNHLSAAYGKAAPIHMGDTPSISRVKELIASNHAVEIGLHVFPEYRDNSNWRFHANIDTPESAIGSHVVVLVGYQTQGSSTIFTFLNSWGTGWGQKGYGTVDSATLTHSWTYDVFADFILSVN